MSDFSVLAIVNSEDERKLLEDGIRSIKNLRCTGFFTHDPVEAFQKLDETPFDVVFIDTHPGGMNGIDAFDTVKRIREEAETVMLTDFSDIAAEVEIMKTGAYDFLVKPLDPADIEKMIANIHDKRQSDRENSLLRTLFTKESTFRTIISHSPEMEKVLSLSARAAASDATVLIHGESGTGKELIARAIHMVSPRKNRPFVPVNISALSENLIESELFGHIKGSFTGAVHDRIGRFEMASFGTLFIDEVGDIPLGIQVKLLRALQFGSFERVGNNETQETDVRIIAATNRNLDALIQEGRFRADLFYRINVIPVIVPPLRDHMADIPFLVEHFLKKYSSKEKKAIEGITAEAMEMLMKYSFPGNVRELENLIERAIVLCRGRYLSIPDILLLEPSGRKGKPIAASHGSYDTAMDSYEAELLSEVLTRHGGNKSASARELEMTERRLRFRLKHLGI